jgi:protease-4
VIDPAYMWRIGLASLQELEDAVEAFRAAGKPVIALADTLNQQQYYLAALADEIWLNPKGMVWIEGFSRYRQFYAEGLEKLQVEINLFQAGDYKSGPEPWVRNDMSPEAREANLFWLGDLWDQYLEAVSRNRGIPRGNLVRNIENFVERLEIANGDFARYALDAGLVDKLVSGPEANRLLAESGAPGESGQGYRQVDFMDYLDITALQSLSTASGQVRVVVADGEIMRGWQPQGAIGAETFSATLRAVARDDAVEAVVLRVNSPGGEVYASEKIRLEVEALRMAGKSVVVSMGNVAASGGYWIASAADELWASPATITGSIGVYGLLPTISEPLARLGIRSDGVGTAPLAGRLRLDKPLDENLRRVFQLSVEDSYDDFLARVSESRGMSLQQARQVAAGRVWSGGQALDRDLVDHLGTLDDAIRSAAKLAGLGEDYNVRYQQPEMSAFEQFLVELTAGAMIRLGVAEHFTLNVPFAGTFVEDILDDLARLAANSGQFTLAAHCMCSLR